MIGESAVVTAQTRASSIIVQAGSVARSSRKSASTFVLARVYGNLPHPAWSCTKARYSKALRHAARRGSRGSEDRHASQGGAHSDAGERSEPALICWTIRLRRVAGTTCQEKTGALSGYSLARPTREQFRNYYQTSSVVAARGSNVIIVTPTTSSNTPRISIRMRQTKSPLSGEAPAASRLAGAAWGSGGRFSRLESQPGAATRGSFPSETRPFDLKTKPRV